MLSRLKRGVGLGFVLGIIVLGALIRIAPAISLAPWRACPGPQLFPGSGVVTQVADGDTLRVRFSGSGERRVRLIGVNSPELDDQREEAAFWAFLARRFANFHLRGRSIRLEYDETNVDEYGRILAYVLTDDGALFNERIIRDGYAYAFLKYPFRPDYRARFKQAETDAKRAGRGLWRNGEPETIAAQAAGASLGRFVRVRFDCATVTRDRGFIFLRPAGRDFEALVPLDRRSAFPRLEDYTGRTVTVTGFLEAFRGRPQIILRFPRQLHLGDVPQAGRVDGPAAMVYKTRGDVDVQANRPRHPRASEGDRRPGERPH